MNAETKKIYFGADYYPEHWPRERWETDAKLMEELGLNVVRMAEFSWAKMEPRLGEFHFEWLDEAIELLAARGIKTVLCTPTAAPPAWIIRADPDILPVDNHGIRREFGGRHHDCQSNVKYRAHIKRFVTAMAEHYKDNPNVIGWQIDNELGNSHDDLCSCDSCAARFRQWLENKYGTIEALNEAWGTCFWSQDYSNFEEIGAPKLTVSGRNPSQMLDWKRFCSDLIVEFQHFQVEILRSICKKHFITHNLMGFYKKTNYFDLTKDLDFVSYDQYPLFTSGAMDAAHHASSSAAPIEFMRSMKKKNIWIMEEQSGPSGWEVFTHLPRPGQLGLWAVQTIAHGADTVVFFRWRSCRVGTEQYWHGILPHSGIPGRGYYELQKMIQTMRPVMEGIKGQLAGAETAILYSYDQEFSIRNQPQNSRLNYIDQIHLYYHTLHRKNIPTDFISDKEDFSKYKLLIAPLQYLMTPELEAKFKAYVEQGGHLVLTMRTGVKDATDRCMTELPLPGKLGELLGITIPEYDSLDRSSGSVTMNGKTYEIVKWSDLIELGDAESIAEYAAEFYAGKSCITRKVNGDGVAWYVGTEPTEQLLDDLVDRWICESGADRLPESTDGIEVTRRCGDDFDTYFVLNHDSKPQTFDLPDGWKQIAGTGEGNEIETYGYRIYQMAK